ncbi:MAG: hypothetical protein F6J87_30910 [Spirulina sp. SIO3F2]|nr:hypothetical protein [Spirulina sp. SIO3F2]
MYFYDPDSHNFWGLVREDSADELRLVVALNLSWILPCLQIRFELFEDGLGVFYPNDELFKTLQEFAQERDQAQQERAQSLQREAQAKTERDRAQQQLARALAKLRELGIEPDVLEGADD